MTEQNQLDKELQHILPGARLDRLAAVVPETQVDRSLRPRIDGVEDHVHRAGGEWRIIRVAGDVCFIHLHALARQAAHLIRDYARNIVSIRAESDGLDVPLEKLDKSRWLAAPGNRSRQHPARLAPPAPRPPAHRRC